MEAPVPDPKKIDEQQVQDHATEVAKAQIDAYGPQSPAPRSPEGVLGEIGTELSKDKDFMAAKADFDKEIANDHSLKPSDAPVLKQIKSELHPGLVEDKTLAIDTKMFNDSVEGFNPPAIEMHGDDGDNTGGVRVPSGPIEPVDSGSQSLQVKIPA